MAGSAKRRPKQSEFARGWYACLAVLCEQTGQANTTEKELWAAGGHGEGADPADLETLAKYGLLPNIPR
jgi:hypothetical protein